MICRLTPIKHVDIADIEQTIIPKSDLKENFKGSFVRIYIEKNDHASNGLALCVSCKGRKLGCVPELASVTKWVGEHHEWTRAVDAIRSQLFLEYDMNGTDEWSGNVASCRYHDGKGYMMYDEYTNLPPEEQSKWKLEQVAVEFPVEVL